MYSDTEALAAQPTKYNNNFVWRHGFRCLIYADYVCSVIVVVIMLFLFVTYNYNILYTSTRSLAVDVVGVPSR